MNPSIAKPNPGPTLVRDVSPTSINAELVDDIPVKNPLGTAPTKQPAEKSPAAQVFKPSGNQPQASDDEELEHILRDVNDSVKKSENTVHHTGGVLKKAAVKKSKLKQTRQGSPPLIATVVACLIASALTAATFLVYRNGS